MKSNFVHLHTHSHYSLLDGACTIDTLVDEARRQGMKALAITDHGNLFGAIEFYQAAMKHGINPIVGYEAYVAPDSRKNKKTSQLIDGKKGHIESAYHLTLLAKNDIGYHNIIKLATLAYTEGFYRKPRIDKELLLIYKSGIVVLSGCLQSELGHLVLDEQFDSALSTATYYRDIFGEDFYLELQQHGIPEQAKVIKGLLEINKKTGISIVATNDIHYLKKEDSKAHDVLLCISTNRQVNDSARLRFSSEEFYFKSADEMMHLFSEIPQAIENTGAIAEKCNLYLDFKTEHLPRFTPPGNKLSLEFIKELAEKGIEKRYGSMNSKSTDKSLLLPQQRLKEELDIIENKKLIDYFLVVWDFVRFAHENNISIGPGRGSAAGSLLAYVLEITDIDPLKYDLLFERFLNPGRYDPPDIDIDFSQAGRERVIDYVREKYGRENVSQIITFGTMKARAVIRDVGRVMGIPLTEVDRIAKKLSGITSLKESIRGDSELKDLIEKRKDINDLFAISAKLEGLCRHASTHAAGVVIADKPLNNYVPLYSNSGIDTTQYPMESLQSIGLLKVDLLGIVTLDIIDKCIELIRQNRHEKVDIDMIPLDDKKTYELLSRGETKGVFQLESAGMRDILQKLKPLKFEDIIAVNALYRPGPLQSGLVDNYIRCKHHPGEITYLHPALESLLKETNGIILYQEQVMRIANKLGGFPLSESDNLRKAMGKKIPEIMQRYGDKFISGAVKNGISKPIAEKIFEMMEYFGGYGFNKSHSTAYSMTSYRTAYLKTKYPVEFMAALLSYNTVDTDKLLEYVEECKRLNIKVLPPDINKSFSDFTVINNDIIFGLSAVKNVGAKAVSYIIEARLQGGPFLNIYDFCERVDLSHVDKLVIESLIKCGSFDTIAKQKHEKSANRNQLIQGLDQIVYISSRHQLDTKQGQLNIMQSSKKQSDYRYPLLPDAPELPEEEILQYEKESLGFYVSGHPLIKYEKMLKELSSLSISQLLKLTPPVENIKICGIISQVQNVMSKSDRQGNKIAFFKLRDLGGVIDTVIYSDDLKKYRHLIHENKIVCIRGRLDSRKGESIIKAKEVAPIENAYEIMPNLVVIDISLTGLDDNIINGLKDVFLAHPGNCQVFLKIKTTDNEVAIVKLSNNYSVSISPTFRDDITELIGNDAIKFSLE
jgi:DNA polymerase III subunit alpha